MSRPKRDVRELPKPVDIHQALQEAVTKISPLGEEYALIGGVALAFYGIERFTKDVDLATTVRQSGAVESTLRDLQPEPLRVGGVSILTGSGVRVDLIDRRFEYRALFEEAIAEAKQQGLVAKSGDLEIPVVPIAHLIAMKLIADRPRDEADLFALLSIHSLDYRAARDVVYRHVGPYAARRLDKLARAAARTDAPPDYENGS